MKIFSWMRIARNNGKERSNGCKPCQASPPNKEDEFSDWPNGLLAIGTFGNAHLHEHHPDADKVELNKCTAAASAAALDEESEKSVDSQQQEDEKMPCNVLDNSLVCNGGREVQKSRSGIGKKSLSYLLKKAFVCKGGFAPSPIAKDLLPDPKSDTSRVDKILRAMLHKKIYPQRPTPKTTTPQKYLDMPATDNDEDENEQEEEEEEHETNPNPKSKWVKTDSEYIVLEI